MGFRRSWCTSRNQNPTHTYLAAGKYSVKLTVTKGAYNSSAVQITTVHGTDLATQHTRAHFVAVSTIGKVPFTVQFIDKSTGSPTAWIWTFGDGSVLRVQNPTHKYTQVGTYTVTLQVWNSNGACNERFLDYIKVTPAK